VVDREEDEGSFDSVSEDYCATLHPPVLQIDKILSISDPWGIVGCLS
jgi:hypothetical protein